MRFILLACVTVGLFALSQIIQVISIIVLADISTKHVYVG